MPTIIFCDSSHILIVQKFITVMDYSLHHLDPLCVCIIEGRNRDTFTNSSTPVAILFGLHSVAERPTAHQQAQTFKQGQGHGRLGAVHGFIMGF